MAYVISDACISCGACVALAMLLLKAQLNTKLMQISAVTVAHVLQAALLTLSLKANLYILRNLVNQRLYSFYCKGVFSTIFT